MTSRVGGAGRVATVAASAGLALAGCAADAGPRLDRATPAAAARGARIDLAGARLCGPSGACERAGGRVQLGAAPPYAIAPVVAWADAAATVTVPVAAPLGPTELVVTVDGEASNALAFEVTP